MFSSCCLFSTQSVSTKWRPYRANEKEECYQMVYSLFIDVQILNASMNVHSFTCILGHAFATAGMSRAQPILLPQINTSLLFSWAVVTDYVYGSNLLGNLSQAFLPDAWSELRACTQLVTGGVSSCGKAAACKRLSEVGNMRSSEWQRAMRFPSEVWRFDRNHNDSIET